jgi:hypothetical protein
MVRAGRLSTCAISYVKVLSSIMYLGMISQHLAACRELTGHEEALVNLRLVQAFCATVSTLS